MTRAHDGHGECCLNCNVYDSNVNCKFQRKCTQKMNVIAKISCYLQRSVVTLKLRKEYLNTVTHNTSILLWLPKELNSLIYWTIFYVNIYGSYKLSKNSPVFWPTLYLKYSCIPVTSSVVTAFLADVVFPQIDCQTWQSLAFCHVLGDESSCLGGWYISHWMSWW